jgi:hypothetical protein
MAFSGQLIRVAGIKSPENNGLVLCINESIPLYPDPAQRILCQDLPVRDGYQHEHKGAVIPFHLHCLLYLWYSGIAISTFGLLNLRSYEVTTRQQALRISRNAVIFIAQPAHQIMNNIPLKHRKVKGYPAILFLALLAIG